MVSDISHVSSSTLPSLADIGECSTHPDTCSPGPGYSLGNYACICPAEFLQVSSGNNCVGRKCDDLGLRGGRLVVATAEHGCGKDCKDPQSLGRCREVYLKEETEYICIYLTCLYGTK